jgi:hypothetical protein
MQHRRGTGKAELLRDGNEVAQMTEFHSSSDPHSYQLCRFQLAQQAIFLIAYCAYDSPV